MSHPSATIREMQATAAVIGARRIVRFDTTNQAQVLQASAVSDNLIGVVDSIVDVGASRSASVVLSGIAENGVVAGAAFAAGAKLTTDSQGRAVAAAPAAGTNNQIVGIALEQATAAGDIVRILVQQCTVQG